MCAFLCIALTVLAKNSAVPNNVGLRPIPGLSSPSVLGWIVLQCHEAVLVGSSNLTSFGSINISAYCQAHASGALFPLGWRDTVLLCKDCLN